MQIPSKITVIGGSGFIGTNLCRKLSDRQIEFEIIDIRRSRQFPEKSKIGDVRDLGSGLIDQIQKMTTAAMQIADRNAWAQRS